jgi:hypothetical protein
VRASEQAPRGSVRDHYPTSGSPLNRSKLEVWNILVLALIIRGPSVSSMPGSGLITLALWLCLPGLPT